ncbi:MAG: 4Fe-4S dicluster domain-containing protein [Sulfurospirillaceae bacterium]|jgi:Fe-S-cluster-containing dehydrogenase component|nr:4Fe-4S dicluster domain-containing protein [Sulfurospirillaceae bacterium]MDD2825734.1 4Fe-4S dicluster domain-containing protein [Sulfurospirillaceae bacterium]
MTKKYGMIIDLHRCVGCGACNLACKSENNTPVGIDWASHKIETYGVFPKVTYTHTPTLCNHCEDAPCVRVCPTHAMHKTEEGFVVHDPSICIGCKSCMLADPYGVIHFNTKDAFIEFATDTSSEVKDGTFSKKELSDKSKAPFPNFNAERGAGGYEAIRRAGAVEKCTFCNHRVAKGLAPACVVACPADARIFGDMNDPKSQITKVLKENKPTVLLPEKGTNPKVFYIGSYN